MLPMGRLLGTDMSMVVVGYEEGDGMNWGPNGLKVLLGAVVVGALNDGCASAESIVGDCCVLGVNFGIWPGAASLNATAFL